MKPPASAPALFLPQPAAPPKLNMWKLKYADRTEPPVPGRADSQQYSRIMDPEDSSPGGTYSTDDDDWGSLGGYSSTSWGN